MKKKIFLLFILFLLFSLGLISCGRGYAKITGIYVCVTLPNDDLANTHLLDENTITENDYILQAGKEYDLTVTYTAYGGSRYPVLFSDNIKLHYDENYFEVSRKSNDKYMQTMRYNLVCKCDIDYAAILVEVDEKYFTSIIISTKHGVFHE